MIEKEHIYLITIGESILTTQTGDGNIHYYGTDNITEAIKTKQFIQQYTDKKVDYQIIHKSDLHSGTLLYKILLKGGSQNDQGQSKRTTRKLIPRTKRKG